MKPKPLFKTQFPTRAVSLLELVIVVAIIAILAAIAMPNFLNAQTRTKVAVTKSDMKVLATALASYRVAHGSYPEGTDNPANYPEKYASALNNLAAGYYSFRTRAPGGLVAGKDFATLTTPVSYIAVIPLDPFGSKGLTRLPYAYRPSKGRRNGYILTSAGPDADLFAKNGIGNANPSNPYSTAADPNSPARLADINERAVIHALEGTANPTVFNADREQLEPLLEDLTYDPSNGTISEGDLYRLSGRVRMDPDE